ncbi:MAG: DinB family protein [Planctomycetota bacterium]|nr:DinB family protein [Planctomycetota bacterium]
MNRAAGNLAAERDLLLAVLRGALSGGWQGPTLTSAVRGLTPELAAASVSGRKSIWQQLLHVAFWKRRVLNMLVPDRTPFPRRGANWPSLPERIDADTWLADLALLEGLNERLLRAVSELPASRYSPKVRQAIFGIAAHDIYHAGQMNLIRRLLGERTSPQSRQKPQGKPKPNREPKATTRKRTT